ncbi:hypothetical protein WEU38_18185 (plasmid) [Cyanobacterium aponinum AL20118]|uniref:Uncharacterized protein n=1 Tax=Cyanobacterium aponinum AL20115 TaxID=3090662 RepID=A0AAF0ZIX9_9CHRO|nr:hypothetical protein [Cyanobacterium aponinum]WPF90499.1 hypothetical protein SAY89_18275 [Cyanobacterium aponinum AL20115]
MNKTSKGLNRYEIHLSDKLMSEIESIAMMEGAKVHHISKKPIIKDTVISLLELGIKAVFEGVELPKKPNDTNTDNDNRIDLSELDNRIEEKLKPLYSLVSELTDKLNRIANTDKDSYSDINTDTVTEYELIGIEKTEDSLFTSILDNVQTEEKAPSECPTLPLNEDLGDKLPEQENKPKDEQKELTDLQKEVLEKIAKIPSGDKFSFNSLSKELKISRTVLRNFDDWKEYFFIIEKGRGYEYIKI